MNKMLTLSTAFALLLSLTACDWSSGSQDNFNTSNQSALTNISGFYKGLLGGGRVVGSTSNGNIVSMTIQQSGNRVEIIDNQGSKYTGSVGSPVLTALAGADIPAGAVVSTYQISFSGKDGVAARDIEFTGTITLVAVTDIVGNTVTNQNDNTNESTNTSETTVETDLTIPQQNGVDGVEPGSTTTTTDTTTNTSTNTNTSSKGNTVEYSLTDASTQLRMRGTWVEVGGKVSSVDALAAGIQGNFTAPAP